MLCQLRIDVGAFCLFNIEGGVVAQSPDVSCQVSFDAGCKQIFPKYFSEKMRVLCRIEEGAKKSEKRSARISDFLWIPNIYGETREAGPDRKGARNRALFF